MLGGTKRVTSAVATATALVLLCACQGDPKPVEPTGSPTSAAPTAAPTLPAKGRENSSEGVTTFVAYWVNSLNYATRTGDISNLQSASGDACEGCNAYLDLIKKVYANDGNYKGGQWTIGRVLVQREGASSSAFAEIRAAAGTVQLSRDGSPRRERAFEDELRFDLRREANGYAVISLTRKSDDA